MAVYYKFMSEKDYNSMPIDSPFISVGNLKPKIFESKRFGRDADLVIINALTNEEYDDEAMLIPQHTSVLVRRVPRRRCFPIVVVGTELPSKVEITVEETSSEKSSFLAIDSSTMKYIEAPEQDEFGGDIYAIPEARPSKPTIPAVPPTNKADEDSKIKNLIDAPALVWQRQGADAFGPGGGFDRGMGGKTVGRGFGFELKTPPRGYVCHRCKIPGHFIQHCPTNGDPNYDIKRVKPPAGIPNLMLQATIGDAKRTIGELPPELHCPLCKEGMKDAVLTSKCCFNSFCGKCIKDHIISEAQCVCGATNILADDLRPNKTLRDTINRFLGSGNSSTDNTRSTFKAQDMESASSLQHMNPSSTMSAASKERLEPDPAKQNTPTPSTVDKVVKEKPAVGKQAVVSQQPLVTLQQVPEKLRTEKVTNVSNATSQGNALLAEEEVQHKQAFGDKVKKKKKMKFCVPQNDMWKGPQHFEAENYVMPMGPSAYNPYWSHVQPGTDGYMACYAPGRMPSKGNGLGPMDVPFLGMMRPEPFPAQGFTMPPVVPPHRNLVEIGRGGNVEPPALSREKLEAHKADLKRRHESERRPNREFSSDQEFNREMSNGADVPSLKNLSDGSPRTHYHHRSKRMSLDRPTPDTEPSTCILKRKSASGPRS